MNTNDIKVITYHSSNAKPDEQWLGYVVLSDGNQWLVRFSGSNEQAVITKARSFYMLEKSRLAKLHGNQEDDRNDVRVIQTNRGHHLAGLVWVINRELHDLKRIKPEELAGYEARGYVKGGPRSK